MKYSLTIYNINYSLFIIHSSYRFGFGRFTTVDEVLYTAEKCIKHVQRLREMRLVFQMNILNWF